MKTTKFLATAALLLATVSMVSCSDDKEGDEPTLTNKIYMTVPSGTTNISSKNTDEITVEVSFSSALAEATSFEFEFTGATPSAMTVIDNPMSLAKGATKGSVKVKASGADITEPITLTLAIKNLDAKKYVVETPAVFTLTPPTKIEGLTEEQMALIAKYKSEKGIDLTPWMGNINLTGTIEFPGEGSRAPFVEPTTITLGGQTALTLGSEATEDVIALTMVSNPMGMTDYLYDSMLKLTVKDKEYFDVEDSEQSLRLMELLEWNENSTETFEVSLPNIKIVNYNAANQTADIEFAATGDADYMLDKNGEKIYSDLLEDNISYNYHTSWIPFAYKYSAWDRNLDLFAAGNAEIIELLNYNVVADPKVYLGVSDINEDVWEIEENNLYASPKGSIDFANGKMTFEFPFDHADQTGYSRVKVSYSLAK